MSHSEELRILKLESILERVRNYITPIINYFELLEMGEIIEAEDESVVFGIYPIIKKLVDVLKDTDPTIGYVSIGDHDISTLTAAIASVRANEHMLGDRSLIMISGNSDNDGLHVLESMGLTKTDPVQEIAILSERLQDMEFEPRPDRASNREDQRLRGDGHRR